MRVRVIFVQKCETLSVKKLPGKMGGQVKKH